MSKEEGHYSEDLTRELFFFTLSFPYGHLEQYIGHELEILAEYFEKVHIVPAVPPKGEARPIPTNAEVVHIPPSEDKKGKQWVRGLIPFLKDLFKNLHRPLHWRYLKEKAVNMNVGAGMSLGLEDYLERVLEPENAPVFYTYWFYDWANALALLKRKGKLQHFVSRCHLGDLYDFPDIDKLALFRSFKLRWASAVFPVSDHGRGFLAHVHPDQAHKIKTQYLGVKDPKTRNPDDPEAPFRLVSCSRAIPRKRLDLILEAIKKLDFPVEWIHIGGGGQLPFLQEEAEKTPSHVKVEFKGQLLNKEVLDLYRHMALDLFVNVSQREGIPVTMMEAASFHIPIMAVRSFGIPELVQEKSGLLLEPEIGADGLADKIAEYRNDPDRQEACKEGAYEVFRERFDADKNYHAFAHLLRSFVDRSSSFFSGQNPKRHG